MASKPRAVYGKRAAPPKSAYSFDFESPVKPPRPERGNNAFEFDEEEDEEGPRSRGGKWKPRTPTKRVGRTDAVDAKGRGSDPHYDHVGSSPPKRPRTTKSAAAKYDMFEFSDEDEDDVQAKGRTRAGNSRVGAMKSQALPPAKTSKKRTLLPSQDAPRQPTPERDTEDLDPWELPHSSSAKQFPSQPNSPAKQSRPTNKPTTPKKKQPTLTEKILSSPVKDDYFEITVPAHLLRPPPAPSATSAPPAIPKSPSKSRKLIPKKNDSDDSDEAMDGPVSFSQRSGGASTQTSHSQTSQRSRPRPKDDPFSLLDSPPAAQKRGVAARMKAANGRTVDPLSREPPAASPEPIAIAAKPPSPRKLPRSRLSAPPSATPLDPRDAEMQRAIRSMLAAPAPGKAIVGITKMIGTSVALLGSEVGGGEVPLAPGIGTGTASNPPPPPDTRAANGGNQSSSGSRRTYGRRGGMAGAVPQPAPAASSESGKPTGGGGAGSAFPMDLATVADMGSERRPVVQEEPEDDSDLRSKVATRHELSMSGAARMFVDGVEYLLDGLASYQPMSTRRSSAIELVRKVGTSDDVGKLRAHGFVSRILELLSSETDSILLACAGSIACALLADRRIAELAAAEDDPAALRIGLACLASEIDPLVGASWGGNKSDKAKIRELKQVLASSGAAWSMFGEDPSMRGMAVVVIDSLLAHSRRSDGAASLFTSRGGILLLCNFLVANNPGFYATERALRVLEGATMLNPENQAQAIAVESLLDSIVGIMEKAANAARGPDPVVRGQGLDCHIAALKTLINLSNDDEKCAQRLCSVPKALPTVLKNLFLQAQKWHSPVSTAVAPEEKAREYDTMVLIVGLLVNLAGLHAGCRDSVRELRVSVSCPGTGKCADLCACGKRESGLVGLVDVFKRCRVASFGSSGDQADEERDRNVLLSYLALLLGCLVRENDTNAALIRPLLPGATFATLRKQLEDFAAYQRDVMYTRAEAAGESVGAGDQIEKDVLEMVELLRIRDESY